jgi:hypothetical protein
MLNVQDNKLKPYFNIRNDLSISSDGLLLKNSKIVIPEKMQKHIVDIGHKAHQSAHKTKQLLEQFVWFPGMNALVDSVVDKCRVCRVNSEKKRFEPLRMSVLPNGVWQQLATDFHGPDGQHL